MLAVALPVGVFIGVVYLLHSLLLRSVPVMHLVLAGLAATVLAGAVLLAAAGVSTSVCLLVVAAAPVVAVIGDELIAHRHTAAALARTGA